MIEINVVSGRQVVLFPLGMFKIPNDMDSVILRLQSRALFSSSEVSLQGLWSIHLKSVVHSSRCLLVSLAYL